MTQEDGVSQDQPTAKPRPRPRRPRRLPTIFSLWFPLFVIFTLATIAIVALTLTKRPVALPDWATTRIETALNERLKNQAQVRIGQVEVSMLDGILPRIHLRNVALSDASGSPVASLAELQAGFNLDALLSGRIDTREVSARGAEITLLRRGNGQFSISFGQTQSITGDLTAVLDRLEQVFSEGPFAQIDRIELADLTIGIEDVRANRVWQITGGRLDLVQDGGAIDAGLTFEVFNGTEVLTPVQLALHAVKGTPEATISAKFSSALSGDIALQSPALSFLALLDAPLSGDLGLVVDDKGQVGNLAGELTIGAGRFAPATGGQAVDIQQGRAVFHVDPAEGRISFDQLSLRAGSFDVDLAGAAMLDQPKDGGWPSGLTGQFSLRTGGLTDRTRFIERLQLTGGAADFRLNFNPFSVDVGQAWLTDGLTNLRLRGEATAPVGPDGTWTYRAEADADQIAFDRLFAYWPLAFSPRPRTWIAQNVREGTIENLHGVIRSRPGDAPERFLSWTMRDARLRFLRNMPDLQDLSGYGTISDNRLALVTEKGRLVVPDGVVTVDGTTMLLEDMRIRPTPAIFDLHTDGPLAAALDLINRPPLRVMDRAGQPVTLATGWAKARTALHMPLKRGTIAGDFVWSTLASLTEVVAPELVPTGKLRARELTLRADPTFVEIAGPMTLDDLPFTASFAQKIGTASDGTSSVTGQVDLGPTFVEEFAIGLPNGSVAGQGSGDFRLDFARDRPIRFALDSDLTGLKLKLTALSWSKAAKTAGTLSVAGHIDGVPVIDQLSFDAANLKTSGKISVSADGGLDRAEFDRVRLGGWLDAPVTMIGRGRDASPSVEISGGRIDFRKAAFGSGIASDGGPMSLRLDELTVADGIVLTDFRGEFTSQRGFQGSFVSSVNNLGRIDGRVTATAQGSALEVTSQNAGNLLANANVAKRVRGGALELRLAPTGETGTYTGFARIEKVGMKDVPALAALLSAISGVGLLQQLGGEGITFDELQANFVLTPTYLQFTKASAIGPSMGISVSGSYTLGSGALNMRGTLSPIYFINGIGQIFSRKGDGLFGFDFRLVGTADDPKVKVNPLSILTPGMFKELFRRPPPEPVQ